MDTDQIHSGWGITSLTFASQSYCFTPTSIPTPSTVSISSDPQQGHTIFISDKILTTRYALEVRDAQLSIGAKAGIGVAVGLAVMILALTVFLYVRRERINTTQSEILQQPPEPKEAELEGTPIAELDGQK
jgi:hypothetical protein